GHLVVEALDARGHFVVDGAGDDHEVGLAGRGAEGAGAEAIEVETASADGHHLDGAAGEAEGHGPEGVFAGPVDGEVEAGDDEAFFETVFDPGHGEAAFRVLYYYREERRSQAGGGGGAET